MSDVGLTCYNDITTGDVRSFVTLTNLRQIKDLLLICYRFVSGFVRVTFLTDQTYHIRHPFRVSDVICLVKDHKNDKLNSPFLIDKS